MAAQSLGLFNHNGFKSEPRQFRGAGEPADTTTDNNRMPFHQVIPKFMLMNSSMSKLLSLQVLPAALIPRDMGIQDFRFHFFIHPEEK
jgi:hypothetical protein